MERGGLQDHLKKTCAHHTCIYAASGCKEVSSESVLDEHKNKCVFRPAVCPHGPLFDCEWQGTQAEVENHLKRSCAYTPCRHRKDVFI